MILTAGLNKKSISIRFTLLELVCFPYINDILDMSKVESGKMEIVPSNYSPMNLLRDVANQVMR